MSTEVDRPRQHEADLADSRNTPAGQTLGQMLHVSALQEIQDGYTAVTGLEALIVDPSGQPITQPSHCDRLAQSQRTLRDTIIRSLEKPEGTRFEVPIVAGGAHLGAIVLTGEVIEHSNRCYQEEAELLADRFAVDAEHRDEFIDAVKQIGSSRQSEAVRFVYLLADAIAEVCRQQLDQQQRVEELSTLYQLSTLLSQQRDLQKVLDTVAQSATEVLNAKAASIRLLDTAGHELIPQAVHNLSSEYLAKGPVLVERSLIDQEALEGDTVYIPDMATDPRTVYPEDARREKLASILSTGLIYRGRRLGVMRVYTEEPRKFSEFEQRLIEAVAQLAAAAIENARLEADRSESRRVRRQVELAADVQRRLLPAGPPNMPPFDVAGRYEPCFELGGDFFDYIPFEHTLGVTIGDVVGKGVAASLLMTTVRAAIRAHAEDTYDLDEVLSKVNSGLTRDTSENEFATVFYGTLDARSLRLTYCSAGHDPAYLLRDGQFQELTIGGTVLGIDRASHYEKGLIDLEPGDVLFIYSDGVPDAANFSEEKYGRERLREAVLFASGGSAQDIVNHVLWEVRRFVGLHSASDDMTLVAVKVDPNAPRPIIPE